MPFLLVPYEQNTATIAGDDEVKFISCEVEQQKCQEPRMTGEAEVTKWVSPKTERILRQRARDRANTARWDLDVAVFLFGVLAIVIILVFQGIRIEIVAPVSIFGLASVWLEGWRRGRQAYQRFYDEELTKHPDEWEDYYKILHISPSAQSEAIIAAYERLSHIYNETLSDDTKSIPVYSLMRRETNEAYQVLSDPLRRTAYDRVFWLRYSVESAEIPESEKQEIIALAQSIAHDVHRVSEGKRWITWRIPGWSKVTGQVVLAVVIALLLTLLGGTSLAIAKPEHAMATPFKGIAIILTKTSAGAIGLIEDVRGIAAMHERSIVSTALQSLRVDQQLKEITPMVVSTNDMAQFPSPVHPLFPDYLETRFSQFKYTVDSNGSVSVDTSWATTDALLEKIKQLLDRLEEKGKK